MRKSKTSRRFVGLTLAASLILGSLVAPDVLVDRVMPRASAALFPFEVDRNDDAIVSGCSPAPNDCTLRGAIIAANNDPGPDTINFNIPGTGVRNIAPTSPLPPITDQLTINGYSQPGSSQNTLAVGTNAVLLISLDGVVAGASSGLDIRANNSVVRGLIIHRWTGSGIDMTQNTSLVRIEGNFIGTNAAGTAGVGNGSGIFMGLAGTDGSDNATIGGTDPAARNIISGNTNLGIQVGNGSNNKILGNLIGTDATGNVAIGNGTGIRFSDTNASNDTRDNFIGGTAAGSRNVISGNGIGIHFEGFSTFINGNKIEGNYIGTNAAGTADLGNTSHGIFFNGASLNTIGGATAAARNIISGNDGNAILMDATNTEDNVVQGNYIGVDVNGSGPLGNSGTGVRINSGVVGGNISSNVIAFNGAWGVFINSPSDNIDVLTNSIYSNTLLGINLTPNVGVDPPSGVTPNDPGDGDGGANNLQNFPVITVAALNQAGNQITIQGTINTNIGSNITIQLFASDECDPTGFGEGKNFLGATGGVIGASGTEPFSITTNYTLAQGQYITATATGPLGTSEFSACLAVMLPGAGTLQFNAPALNVSESAGNAIATVTRTGGTTGTATVNYTTSNGTAIAGQDYTAVSGTLIFAAGETSKTITIPISEDLFDENVETFSINLSGPTGAGLGTPQTATVSITDNDPPGALFVNDTSLAEGNFGTTNMVFTVNLSSVVMASVTVKYATSDGTATAGSDYQTTNGTLIFNPGETSKTVSVPIFGDMTPEGNETLFLTLSDLTNATISDAQATGTITDDDSGNTLQFNAASYSVNESGGTATITVTRTGDTSGAVTVNYATSNGTATAGSDYTNSSGTLFFASGEASKTFTVPITNDSLSEGTETVNLILSLPTGNAVIGAQSTATLFIFDDEAPPPPDLFAVTTTNALLRLNANVPGTIISSVAITGLQPGENVVGIDFRPATGQLYALGSTSRLYTINSTTGAATQVGSAGAFTLSGTDFGFDFNPVPDRIRVVSDSDQNLRLNPNDGTLTATDTLLTYAAGDPNSGLNPNVTGAAYTNNFTGTTSTTLYGIDSNLDVLVRQGSPDGSPVSPNTGQLFTIGSLGVNTTGLTGFDIRSDNTAYASLTSPGDTSSRLFRINLSTGASTLVGTIGGPALIRDIAVAPAGTFQFSAATTSVGEAAGRVTVTVNRTGTITGAATVNVSTVDGTATQKGDYTIRLATLSFAPGETSKSVDVFIVDDGYVEPAETFTVILGGATGDFTLNGTSTLTVTITDNDAAATNPIANTQFFVRQHYLDFLNREPDPVGFQGWVNILNNCAPNNTACDRVEVSSAFYRSEEFQTKGYFLYRFYEVAFGRIPTYREFMMDLSRIAPLSGAELEAAKVSFIAEFMSRQEFKAKFDALDNTQYVNTLESTAGVSLTNKAALIAGLNGGTETRATVLRKVVESNEVATKFFNKAFVVEAYFGYLRRDPDGAFNTWITTLNTTGNFRLIVNGFVNSAEYVTRFGP